MGLQINTKFESLVKLWGNKVLKGTVELSAVPAFIREDVNNYVADELNKNDMNA